MRPIHKRDLTVGRRQLRLDTNQPCENKHQTSNLGVFSLKIWHLSSLFFLSLKCPCPLGSTTRGREDTHNHHQHYRTQINNEKEEGDHSHSQDAPHPPVPPSASETNTLAQSILGGNLIFLMQGLKALVDFWLMNHLVFTTTYQ